MFENWTLENALMTLLGLSAAVFAWDRVKGKITAPSLKRQEIENRIKELEAGLKSLSGWKNAHASQCQERHDEIIGAITGLATQIGKVEGKVEAVIGFRTPK